MMVVGLPSKEHRIFNRLVHCQPMYARNGLTLKLLVQCFMVASCVICLDRWVCSRGHCDCGFGFFRALRFLNIVKRTCSLCLLH